MALAGLLGENGSASTLRAAGTRVLRDCARHSWGLVLVLVVAMLVQVGAGLLTPAAVGAAIDAAVRGAGLPAALARLAALFAITMLSTAVDDLASVYFGSALTARLRRRLVDRVLALGPGGQRRFPAGDVLSRLTEGASGPESFLPQLLSVGATLLTTIGAVAGLALIDLRLAATFLIGVPVAVPLLRWFVSRAGDTILRYQQVQADLATRLVDAQHGARTIRACGTVNRDIARVLQPMEELHQRGRQLWSAQRRMGWQFSLLGPVLQVAVLAVGGLALADGSISPGDLVAAASYVGLALGIVGLVDTVVALVNCQVGAGRVGEVLETPPSVTAPQRPVALPDGPGRLELRGVTVQREARTVLDSVDLTVPAGVSVALVGRSGSGKSALTGLLGRLFDPDAGAVLLDGVDVATLDPAQLRRAVGYAFESPALLGSTVADLLCYGRGEIPRAQVRQAARLAQADDFIRRLPDGYDTPLEQTPMSGGEQQRLGLARAVLAHARVLVLDDATSSLDTATELRLTTALRAARTGRTSLVVAHRASTAARADLVAWLEHGQIRAFAPHHELWPQPEYRAVFAAHQADGTTPDPGSTPLEPPSGDTSTARTGT